MLLHDGDGYDMNGDRSQTAAALPRILDALLERGYRFVTIPG
jgi:peptidoglycan/xylan/chitin deacetylase (PgdA/CDA1 family)